MADDDALLFAPLLEVSDRLRRRTLSPVELLQAQLARIGRLNPTLRAYLTVLGERALGRAREAEVELARGDWRGPLHGVPIAVKDLFQVAGVPTSCASRALGDFVPARDATVVQRLERAGAVLIGKLHMTEFALSGYHPEIPAPLNPWNAGRTPAGSSSGSAVASAAGLAFGTLGSDTGGSIRFPSAACGVVGLKPTYGRVSRAGVFPLGESLDHVGPIARRVADAAALLEAIAGFDPEDPTSLRGPAPACLAALGGDLRGLRIGVDEAYVTGGVAPAVAEAWRAATQVLAGLGATLVPIVVPPVEALLPQWATLCAAEARASHAPWYPARATQYGPTFRSFLEAADATPARAVAAALHARAEWSGRFARVFDACDAVACPSAPVAALPVALFPPDAPFTADVAPFMRFTAPFDFSGSPTLSVPSGFDDDGLPHSLQLVARHGAEALLCRIGHAYEEATDWKRRRPPV